MARAVSPTSCCACATRRPRAARTGHSTSSSQGHAHFRYMFESRSQPGSSRRANVPHLATAEPACATSRSRGAPIPASYQLLSPSALRHGSKFFSAPASNRRRHRTGDRSRPRSPFPPSPQSNRQARASTMPFALRRFCKSTCRPTWACAVKLALDCAHGATYISRRSLRGTPREVVASASSPTASSSLTMGSNQSTRSARCEQTGRPGIAFDGTRIAFQMCIATGLARRDDCYLLALDFSKPGACGPVGRHVMTNYV